MIDLKACGMWLLDLVWKIALVAVAISVIAFPFMMCWNAVMPFLFALPVIDWGRSFCILVLINLFFVRSVPA